MTDWLILEAGVVFTLNLMMWGFILIFPPIVIKVEKIRFLKLNPYGLTFMNIILIKQNVYSEKILRHELEHVRQHRIFSPVGLGLFILIHYTWLYLKYRSFREVYNHSILEKWANDKMDATAPIPREIVFLQKPAS